LDISPAMFWIKDTQNRFVFTNEVVRHKLLLTTNGTANDEVIKFIVNTPVPILA
jgi:hypothetical protein